MGVPEGRAFISSSFGQVRFLGARCEDSDILKLIKIGKYSMSDACWSSVSDNAKHLIKSCLEMVPRKRITAQDALHHASWLETLGLGKMDSSLTDPWLLLNLGMVDFEDK